MEEISSLVNRFQKAFIQTLPVIFFFLTAFIFVYAFFGMQYIMIVSIITVFFQTRYKNNDNALYRYVKLFVFGSILIFLAYLSSINVYLCIILNFLVPFILVFTQSSQFRPKGYFSYAMLFAFTALIPPTNLFEVLKQIMVFSICVVFLAFSIWFYYHFFLNTKTKNITLKYILCELSDMMQQLIQSKDYKNLEKRFQDLIHNFNQASYHNDFISVQTTKIQIYDMTGTLIQRFSYLIADYEWKSELTCEQAVFLNKIAVFLKETAYSLDSSSETKQIKVAQEYLDNMDIPEGRLRIFCRSVLHMIILILKTKNQKNSAFKNMGGINIKEILHMSKARLSFEAFETRVALRLSAVMTISCVASYMLDVTHSYWIPLNAFLLIQPSCEESSYRMKTRPIGTLIGCILEFMIHPFLPGLLSQLLFSLVMISLMYCALPGTWYQPIFSTCYSLTLAGMTINETTAITLRFVFLCVAIIIVFIVNSFFFPIRKSNMFKHNINILLRLNYTYLNIIKNGIYKDTELAVSCGILTYFNMILEECSNYLRKNKNNQLYKNSKYLLITLWHMFSELEQLHYIVRLKLIDDNEKQDILNLIYEIQSILNKNISYDNISMLKNRVHYKEPELNYVLNQYLNQTESLKKQLCV